MRGRAFKFGDNISTDHIIPGRWFHLRSNLPELAKHILEDVDPDFVSKVKKGDFIDENTAVTESDIEETLRRMVVDLHKSPQEVFEALKNQTVDLVFTAHPTQSVRRSLLQKHGRYR